MTQQEETLSVAKSSIIFKTTDEWFKTLVSGIVETFFPDKELTFSIEIKQRKEINQMGKGEKNKTEEIKENDGV